MTKLLCIAGSLRTGAFSKQLARAAAALARAGGAEATCVDLRDHPMPLYDGDLEAASGLPEAAVRLRTIVQAHDALLIATPEYNASLPAVLKNALDWLSRPYAAEPTVSPFRDKVAGIMASSPGALGGMRALVHLRQVLMNLGVLVVTEQFALGNAERAFAADGGFADAKQAAAAQKVVQRVLHVAGRLRG
ncbi:MAG: NAD(P)H-dependent oxidoreductase [Planctomycetes bacterium]|nr:NAD(P)H-dependent oxidoreductase [Planctomycetota bacterium]